VAESDNSQLQMSFERSGNRFRESLNSGDFLVFAEVNTSLSIDDESKKRAADIVDAVQKIDFISTALAFTSDNSEQGADELVSFASSLIDVKERDQHLLYLSGKNISYPDAASRVSLCKTEGWKNIIPVSGNGELGKSAKEHGAIPFTDGVHILSDIKASRDNDITTGCVVNPYKYTPESLYSQCFKLIKKINLGASFIVTQTGWDMMKLQELRWFLTNRDLYTPSIARLELLTPERSDDIVEGNCPGLHASPDFQSILANEASFSNMQFEAAQWRRLQLQAAGCKFLGYSGIQLSGLKSKDHINIASRRIAEVLDEFDSFETWKEAYESHLARGDMAPYPYRFYMFNNLFSTDHLNDEPVLNDAKLPECGELEKIKYKLTHKILMNSKGSSAIQAFLKRVLVGGCSCSIEKLRETHYMCMDQCPKGLTNGPCGGTQPGGECELDNRECVHSQRMRRAVWLNELNVLEENYLAPVY